MNNEPIIHQLQCNELVSVFLVDGQFPTQTPMQPTRFSCTQTGTFKYCVIKADGEYDNILDCIRNCKIRR